MQFSKKYLTTIFLHISVWGLFALLPMLLLPKPEQLPSEVVGLPNFLPFIVLLRFLILALIFYANYIILIPRIWLPYGWLPYLLVISICMLLAISFQIYIHQLAFGDLAAFNPLSRYEFIFERLGLMMIIFVHLLVWAVSSGFWLLREWKKSEERLKESELQRTANELQQLKKQLNPHFLFNTLNGIYALTLSQDKMASNAVLQLSKLMSYVLVEANADVVEVEKDIAHLQHFIELNQLRLTDKSPLYCDIKGDFRGYTVAPLLLLTFVENAFKYGVSNVEHSPIEIRVRLLGNRLSFSCRNQLIRRQQEASPSSGVGIANARRRLKLLYPDQHELKISEAEGYFDVQLDIELAHASAAITKSKTIVA
ncbi:MAG: histidine kinase [Bacteroidota bacterium]